jgi:hypothetical protein
MPIVEENKEKMSRLPNNRKIVIRSFNFYMNCLENPKLSNHKCKAFWLNSSEIE